MRLRIQIIPVKVIIFNFSQCTFDLTKNWNGYLFMHYQLKIPDFHGFFDIHKVLLSLIWSQITDFGLWFDPKNWQTSQRSDYKKHSVPLHFFYVFFTGTLFWQFLKFFWFLFTSPDLTQKFWLIFNQILQMECF